MKTNVADLTSGSWIVLDGVVVRVEYLVTVGSGTMNLHYASGSRRGSRAVSRDAEFDVLPVGDRFRPRRAYRCQVCGGLAHRRMTTVAPIGMEDVTQPLLHSDLDDWLDNPHDVIPEEGT